jgi:hypothetical protein
MNRLMLAVFILLVLAECRVFNIPVFSTAPQATATQSAADTLAPHPTDTLTPSATPLAIATPSATATATRTPTTTLIPTVTSTATISPTPTFDFPDATVLEQANCRYGPGVAYLYSHGLYTGDRAEVNGRSASGTWLWIQPENLERHCWAAASVLEVVGDIMTVKVVQSQLPYSDFYGPPEDVEANRDGDEVTISWDRVEMTEDDDRGYLIEAVVCQNGQLVGVAVQTEETSYTLDDDNSCSGESSGRLYTVDKHGYSDPVEISWP